MKCSCCGQEKDKTQFRGKNRQCNSCLNMKKRERAKKKRENNFETKKNINVVDIDFKQIEDDAVDQDQDNTSNDSFDFDVSMFEGYVSDSVKALFDVISKRLGDEWIISNTEAKNIGVPLLNIIAKSPIYSKMMQNADIVGLITALSITVIPRIIYTINKNKEEKTIETGTEKGNSRRNKAEKDNASNTKIDTVNENTSFSETFNKTVNY